MTKSNMYSFIGNDTWNPLGGECSHACSYCYVTAMKFRPVIKAKYSGEIRLHEKAFKEPLGKGKFWFVCSCNDLFADNVPDWMIIRVLQHLQKYDFDNKFLLQTKNPDRYHKFVDYYPEKVILCATIESDIFHTDFMGDTRAPYGRFEAMRDISYDFQTMITIEPIMQFNLNEFVDHFKTLSNKKLQVNIGANSNPKINLPEPEPEKIRELIKELEKFTTVHLKPNLKRLLPEVEE